jgi:hypothetical protein
MKKTRIKCQHGDAYHAITFHDDGRVESSGCGDVTAEAEQIGSLVILGGSIAMPTCAGLAAFVRHGIRALFSKPDVKPGDELLLLGWRDLYQRFESLNVVEAAIAKERKAARQRRKRFAPTPPITEDVPL